MLRIRCKVERLLVFYPRGTAVAVFLPFVPMGHFDGDTAAGAASAVG